MNLGHETTFLTLVGCEPGLRTADHPDQIDLDSSGRRPFLPGPLPPIPMPYFYIPKPSHSRHLIKPFMSLKQTERALIPQKMIRQGSDMLMIDFCRFDADSLSEKQEGQVTRNTLG